MMRLVNERRLMKQMLIVGWIVGVSISLADLAFFRDYNWAHTVNIVTTLLVLAVAIPHRFDHPNVYYYLPFIWVGMINVAAMAVADNNTDNAIFLILPAMVAAVLFVRDPLAKWLVIAPSLAMFVGLHLASGTRQDAIEIFALTPLMLGVAAVTSMLFARVRNSAEEQLRMQGTATALLMALEARDGYTADHSNEVLDLVDGVAQRLGLDEQQRRVATYVALLHDIGKIGIPNHILHKPSKLTEDEWLVMKEHPAIGERILRELPGFEAVARAVRHEHERFDGGGYPDGIAGEEIPIYSRIVLVCDAYHAMTSTRPYRKAMGESFARTELLRHAGTQFDPDVVDAMLREIEDRQIAAIEDRNEAARHLQTAYDRALERAGIAPGQAEAVAAAFEEAQA